MLRYGFNSNISESLRKILSGKGYVFTHIFLDIPIDATRYIRFKTNDKHSHVVIKIEAEGKSIFKTYANTTYTNGGTLTSSFNRKTSASDDSDVDIYVSPTIDGLGDLRGERLILGGTVGQTTGATGGDVIESIIAPNTEFLISVTNTSTAAKDIGIAIDWHESDY